jgi:phosphatidate cytidylyltransferase
MSNLLQRLFLFFLGVPAVLALIVFLPQLNHLAAVLVIVAFTGGCALELASLLKARGISVWTPLVMSFGALLPLGAYLGGLSNGADPFYGACLGLLVSACILLLASFARFAFIDAARIREVIAETSALAFAAVYPGLCGAFIVLVASVPRYATESLLSFCILAFSGDSIAWLVGMTMGKHRGVVAVSPNKSVEGFVGGLLASTGMAFACALLFPEAIDASWWELLILGFVTGAAVIVGDLFESAIKRSAGTKDSGSAVPGRGGFLDSFDSLLFAAPVFFGLSQLLGLFR